MKKPKFLFKIDQNLRGKVYINKKWQKDVASLYVCGEPFNYTIRISQYKRDKNKRFIVENNEIQREDKVYFFKRNASG